MRKSIWLLILLSLTLPFQAQVKNDSIQNQNNHAIVSRDQSAKDSVRIIEKAYLHTDRTYYYAGDDIWFKAYLIESFSGLPSGLSNSLHVELISPASQIISSHIIRIDSGLGHGDFKLPEDIKTGSYFLRSYTNYMRNFGDQLFFNKEITVINGNDEKNEIQGKVKYVENKIQISFFPEGGSLVDNVSSIVAFKAVNGLGKGCDIRGKVFSSAGDLITTFSSTHLGMGSFFLRPQSGLRYYSIFRGADSTDIRADLPASFSTGVNLGIIIDQNNELLVTTKTNAKTLQLVSGKDLKLDLSVRKDVIKTVQYKIKDLVTNFIIPTDDLPDGIVMVSLTTPDGLPLSERLVYIQKEEPLSILIKSDKSLYEKREPISLSVALSGDSIAKRKANVSLAVIDKRLTETTSKFPRTISSWFLLESEVYGYIEDPAYYFDPSNPERLRDLDLLLRTQGWRDFSWKYDKTFFPPENGFTISGRFRRYYLNKTVEGGRVSMGIFGKGKTLLKNVEVDSLGKFKLSGIDFTGEARLIVSGIDKKDRMKGILLLDSMIYIPAEIPERQPQLFSRAEINLDTLKSQYKIYEAVQKRYKLSDTISLGEVKIISEHPKDPQTLKVESSRALYLKPEGEIIITRQMYHYSQLIETMRGRIAGVELVGKYPEYRIRIRGTSTLKGNPDPLVLVDGIPVFFEELYTMPINFVDRIDVLKSGATAIYGMRGANGVINIITKTGTDTEAYIPVEYSVSVKVAGYNDARVFYSPQHLPDSDSADKPDLRSTLLWNPDINVESKNEARLNYYNGDNSSIFKIVAEGITTTGIPVTGTAEYEVR
jgi:TonB-dependent SusC/RagA subfamily outer membrane receptor